MVRPANTHLAARPSAARRQGRPERRICAGALATAGVLYLASPYVALWSMGAALRLHDDAAMRTSLDWEQVRAGLKDSLGLDHPVQQISQRDELPGFGESFATGVVSGMIDEDITPKRLDAMLSVPALRRRGVSGLPLGFFTRPARFEAEIPMPGMAPIDITMRIEKWRWKVTRITLPEELLDPPPTTRVATTG